MKTKPILPDIDQLIELSKHVGIFATAIGDNAQQSVLRIDQSLADIEAMKEAKVLQHQNDIKTLDGLQETLITIRSGFAELPSDVVQEKEAA